MKNAVLAVFDLDRTLTINRSLESAFILFLLRRRMIGSHALLLSALFYLKNVWRDPVTASKRNKFYLEGSTREVVELWVRKFIEEQGEGFISLEGEQLVRHHKSLGHITILVTGSPDLLVYPLIRCLDLPFDRVYSTDLEVVDGLFTGRIRGTHYYGEEKAKLIPLLVSDLGADLDRSFCYADSKSDLSMMLRFGHPVAVNPDKTLRRTAGERKWEIVDMLKVDRRYGERCKLWGRRIV